MTIMMTIIFMMPLFLVPSVALAHHFMDGDTPRFWYEALLSGLAHPVIGFDHLLFVVACGWVAYGFLHKRWLPFVLIGGTVLGCYAHGMTVAMIAIESWIAVTLMVMGVLVALSLSLPLALWVSFFAVAGIIHGYAYGETIEGASGFVTLFYVVGFALMQYAMMALMARAFRHWSELRAVRAGQMGGALLCVWATVMML